MTVTSIRKYSCDRCNVDYKKDKLSRQRGMLLCPDCRDDWRKTKPFNTHWRSPRIVVTGHELDPVTTPIVYTIMNTGITALMQSQTFRRDGWKHYYVMYVVGFDTGTVVTANPQIVAGQDGDRLTLQGTATYPAIRLNNGNGINITTPYIVLGQDDIISFVYNSSTGWVETSRQKVDYDAVVASGPELYNDNFAYNYNAPYIGV